MAVRIVLEGITAMGSTVGLRVLGGVEALGADGQPVKLGDQQRILLASLLARAGSVVGVDQLAELIWSDRPPADPEAGLHSQVSRLRRALATAGLDRRVELRTRPPGYLLSVAAGSLDAQRFDDLVAGARAAAAAEAAILLEEALGLWHGRAYGEFADLEVARFEAIRLEQARLVAFEAWTIALLDCGRIVEALPALEAFVAEHPLREESRLLLMRALCEVGRPADALAGYRRYRSELAEDLGLDPSASLQELELQILRGEIPARPLRGPSNPASSGPASSSPAPSSLAPSNSGSPGRVASRLPRPLTTFIGRVAERRTLAASLQENRLVTAIGPGGVGKTRLALAVAAEIADRFAGGVYYVDLVPVTDPAMIAPALASVLGIGEQAGRSTTDTVLGRLSDRQALIVLDNCERLLDGVVTLVERLLAECEQVVVLATSRARLQVPYETVFPVPGLSVAADGDSDAVRLFELRAGSAGRTPRPGDRPRIAAICTALDGMALAIELAAARLPVVGLDGLELGLTDRLRLLTGGSRADDRHRSLRSTLDWSHALLNDVDRAVLRRVSVFAAPFSVAAAGAVVGNWPPVGSASAIEAAGVVQAAGVVETAGAVGRAEGGGDAGGAEDDGGAGGGGGVEMGRAGSGRGSGVDDGGEVRAALADLADQSLLTAVAGPDGTRYRALETVRQYGAEMLTTAGERTDASVRHLRWCLRAGAELSAAAGANLIVAPAPARDLARLDGPVVQDHGVAGGGRPLVQDHGGSVDLDAWRAAFDVLADDLRSALNWAAVRSSQRAEAARLAITIADLAFVRGMPGESQRRYEQAAEYASSDSEAAAALRRAAAAALSRHLGDDAIRLYQESAAAAVRAGDRFAAARDLGKAAEIVSRGPGLMSALPPDEFVVDLLDRARALLSNGLGMDGQSSGQEGGRGQDNGDQSSPDQGGGGQRGEGQGGEDQNKAELAARAQVLTAEAFGHSDLDPACVELAERAIGLARRAADPLIESAALDQLMSIQLAEGRTRDAAESARERIRLMSPLAVRAELGLEVADAYQMAAECALAVGDLAGARGLAEASRELPFHHEEGHLATSRLILVTMLAGDWAESVVLAERFRDGWERAGRPRAGNHMMSGCAAVALYGLRGDEETRARWLDLVDAVQTPGRGVAEQHGPKFFDALLLLHQGRPEAALARLSAEPEEFCTWYDGRWRSWYTALWAEAAVLSEHPQAVPSQAMPSQTVRPEVADRLRRARALTVDNPIAAAIVARAEALATGDRPALLAAAAALEHAGCRYQQARTLVLAGGAEADRGHAVMNQMGAIRSHRRLGD